MQLGLVSGTLDGAAATTATSDVANSGGERSEGDRQSSVSGRDATSATGQGSSSIQPPADDTGTASAAIPIAALSEVAFDESGNIIMDSSAEQKTKGSGISASTSNTLANSSRTKAIALQLVPGPLREQVKPGRKSKKTAVRSETPKDGSKVVDVINIGEEDDEDDDDEESTSDEDHDDGEEADGGVLRNARLAMEALRLQRESSVSLTQQRRNSLRLNIGAPGELRKGARTSFSSGAFERRISGNILSPKSPTARQNPGNDKSKRGSQSQPLKDTSFLDQYFDKSSTGSSDLQEVINRQRAADRNSVALRREALNKELLDAKATSSTANALVRSNVIDSGAFLNPTRNKSLSLARQAVANRSETPQPGSNSSNNRSDVADSSTRSWEKIGGAHLLQDVYSVLTNRFKYDPAQIAGADALSLAIAAAQHKTDSSSRSSSRLATHRLSTIPSSNRGSLVGSVQSETTTTSPLVDAGLATVDTTTSRTATPASTVPTETESRTGDRTPSFRGRRMSGLLTQPPPWEVIQ